MFGLSLSLCVHAISCGEVAQSDVEKIIAATKAADDATWNETIEMYRTGYWGHNPDACEVIARELIKAGKVEQPRLDATNPRIPLTDNGIWVKSVDAITYRPWPH